MATSAGFEKRFNEAYSWDGMRRGDEPFIVVQHTLAGQRPA
jgi:AraC family transcriptional regulator